MHRRGFLGALIAAPAFVKASSLMPLRFARGGIATTPAWEHFNLGRRNEAFDLYINGLLVGVAKALHITPAELANDSKLIVPYSSAREALLSHYRFHTPLSRPLDVRSIKAIP